MLRRSKLRCAIVCSFALAAIPTYAALPHLHPNTTKYRETGARPAVGRSGSAAIELRALRGISNDTEIEVTTGHFDSGTAAPGKLDKVQVKLFAPNGKLLITDNYRKSLAAGGYATFSYGVAQRGQKVSLQATVSGIDGSRTDVVSADDVVRLRPDLIVTDLHAPHFATIGANMLVVATIHERNGEAGARANCVLSVDGVDVDHANGIWVDAGDSVTCEFTHHFNSLGVKQISVAATGVAPADYDASNNSIAQQIEVVPPTGVPVRYTAVVHEVTENVLSTTRHHEQTTGTDNDYTLDQTNNASTTTHASDYSTQMIIERAMSFPVTAQAILWSDGQQIMSRSDEVGVSSYTDDGASQVTCGYTFDFPHSVQVCSTNMLLYGQPYQITSAQIWNQSQTVTYYSSFTSITRAFGVESVYSSNDEFSYSTGPQPVPAFGDLLNLRVALTDMVGVYDIDVALPMTPLDYRFDQPEDCQTFDFQFMPGEFSGYDCSAYSIHSFGKQALIFGTDTH